MPDKYLGEAGVRGEQARTAVDEPEDWLSAFGVAGDLALSDAGDPWAMTDAGDWSRWQDIVDWLRADDTDAGPRIGEWECLGGDPGWFGGDDPVAEVSAHRLDRDGG